MGTISRWSVICSHLVLLRCVLGRGRDRSAHAFIVRPGRRSQRPAEPVLADSWGVRQGRIVRPSDGDARVFSVVSSSSGGQRMLGANGVSGGGRHSGPGSFLADLFQQVVTLTGVETRKPPKALTVDVDEAVVEEEWDEEQGRLQGGKDKGARRRTDIRGKGGGKQPKRSPRRDEGKEGQEGQDGADAEQELHSRRNGREGPEPRASAGDRKAGESGSDVAEALNDEERSRDNGEPGGVVDTSELVERMREEEMKEHEEYSRAWFSRQVPLPDVDIEVQQKNASNSSELRRYKLRSLLLQDELQKTRQACIARGLSLEKAEREAAALRVEVARRSNSEADLQESWDRERKEYNRVIAQVTRECEGLQGALAERDDDLDAARDTIKKWKARYQADVKRLNEEVMELDEALYGVEKQMESSQAVWAATELKYRKKLHQMRKHNLQLLEKLKEVTMLEAESLEVVDLLTKQVTSAMERSQQQGGYDDQDDDQGYDSEDFDTTSGEAERGRSQGASSSKPSPSVDGRDEARASAAQGQTRSTKARGSAERGEGKGATSGDDSEEGNGRSRGGGVANVSGGLFDQASAHEAEDSEQGGNGAANSTTTTVNVNLPV